MNSKSIGADFVYAWPDAKVGMMDADLAVKIMYADASADELTEKAKEYDALQGSVMTAARRGYVDMSFFRSKQCYNHNESGRYEKVSGRCV